MSTLQQFFKRNKIEKPNVFYAATKSLCDEDGQPLKWEIQRLTTKEDEKLRDSCTTEIQIPGKPGMYRNKLDGNAYSAKVIAASVVFPDLFNAELQDEYGVKTPEDLIKEMVDDSGEYMAFMAFVQKFNGFNITLQEDIDTAKN